MNQLPLEIPDTLAKLLEVGSYAVVIATSVMVAITALVTKIIPWVRASWDRRALRLRIGLETYDDRTIEDALRSYIQPDCQLTDPSGLEEPRALATVEAPLFSMLRRNLDRIGDRRFIIILADSGMGKTSAVINYCAWHLRGGMRGKFRVAAFYLGLPEVDRRIEQVEDKSNTVLFLDALDEDARAVEDHRMRINHLVTLAAPFRGLVITCRSQFFTRDEEIPRETGIIRFGPRRAGEGAEHIFHKLYISPLSDAKVDQYLRRRYSIFRWKRWQRARAIVDQVPNLAVRPMLLAHIDDLLQHPARYQYSIQIYEEMVRSWVERERGFVQSPEMLLEFSRLLALDLYLGRERRGSESVPHTELETLATSWGITLKPPTLTGRSLLNRDANGNYKFAHRSILEYLCVVEIWERKTSIESFNLSDQMVEFLFDAILVTISRLEKNGPKLPRAGGDDTRYSILKERIIPRSSSHSMLLGHAKYRLVGDRAKYSSAEFTALTKVLGTLVHLWFASESEQDSDALLNSALTLYVSGKQLPFGNFETNPVFWVASSSSGALLRFEISFSSYGYLLPAVQQASSLAVDLNLKSIFVRLRATVSSSLNEFWDVVRLLQVLQNCSLNGVYIVVPDVVEFGKVQTLFERNLKWVWKTYSSLEGQTLAGTPFNPVAGVVGVIGKVLDLATERQIPFENVHFTFLIGVPPRVKLR